MDQKIYCVDNEAKKRRRSLENRNNNSKQISIEVYNIIRGIDSGMYTYDGHEIRQSVILSSGDLVQVRAATDIDRTNKPIGIIIQCKYGFGISGEDWIVFVNGKLLEIPGSMIWPLESYYEF
ncbi:MAG: hypothetical protein CBC29_06770 [Methylococcaceae bacterium TMED69]|nr:MAG: hypothetical protein CBC29_06770 [Methylococcaceae bacterium TMED69]